MPCLYIPAIKIKEPFGLVNLTNMKKGKIGSKIGKIRNLLGFL